MRIHHLYVSTYLSLNGVSLHAACSGEQFQITHQILLMKDCSNEVSQPVSRPSSLIGRALIINDSGTGIDSVHGIFFT